MSSQNRPTVAVIAASLFSWPAIACLLTGSEVHLAARPQNSPNAAADQVMDKRWMHMRPGDWAETDKNDPSYIPYGQTWAGNTILWCFGDGPSQQWTAADEGPATADLNAAWNLWTSSGVDEQTVIFKQGTPADCDKDENPAVLWVLKGELLSTVGQMQKESFMQVSMDSTSALGDRIANFAHEIGHAWGMLHEHQRGDLWPSSKYQGGRNFLSSSITFNCKNVRDWELFGEPLTADEQDQICTSYTAAKQGFSFGSGGAADNSQLLHLDQWLPLPKTFWYEAAGVTDGFGFDTRSIMLYPTYLGGEYNVANNPQLGRKPVLTYPDGSEITANTAPSTLDAEGMMDLYPKTEPDNTPCLLTDDCNSQQTAFRSAQGSSSCPV